MYNILLRPKNKKQFKAIKALVKAFEIDFQEEEIYSPEFIAKMKEGDEDIKNGRTTKIKPADIWNL